MRRSYLHAVFAALLFGVSIPLTKFIVDKIDPWLLAGFLYLGAGIGLSLFVKVKKILFGGAVRSETPIPQRERKWLVCAIFFGGLLAPVFLMYGISRSQGAIAALLGNVEVVFTSFFAWYVFREQFDKRVFLGMLSIVSGSVVLSWDFSAGIDAFIGPLLIVLACMCWAIDNNLTRKISASDPFQISIVKSWAAGLTNTAIALLAGKFYLPAAYVVFGALTIGFFSYGISLVFFVLSLRHIGAARTGAYFATAPFIGAFVAALFLHEPITLKLLAGALLMGLGAILYLTEKHSHEHIHESIEHDHAHSHDLHHRHMHENDEEVAEGKVHAHRHRHERLIHAHPHYPDTHHWHSHE